MLSRVLTDRGTEYCGTDSHEYELYLAEVAFAKLYDRKTPITAADILNDRVVEGIDHTRTKAKSPQTNGICERFHKTVLNEFYRVTFRKKIYKTLDELQADLDAWLKRSGCCAFIHQLGPNATNRCRCLEYLELKNDVKIDLKTRTEGESSVSCF